MSQYQFLIGADPELFVQQEGVFKSAYGLVEGDKANPFKVKDGAVQVDGMALEFNIDPAATGDEFVHNITSVVAQLKAMVPTYTVLASPVAHFTAEYLKAQPHKATELGCTPDYNAWTSKENERPDGSKLFRTGAGHIHIGWTKDANIHDAQHLLMCEMAVKQLDLFLGVPSVLFDADTTRRELYGKAGAYRPKSYGVEYRVLSNVWVGNPIMMRWVYDQTMIALRKLEGGNNTFEQFVTGDFGIQRIINSSDTKRAKILCDHLGIKLPKGV